jgi:hypothetical protein
VAIRTILSAFDEHAFMDRVLHPNVCITTSHDGESGAPVFGLWAAHVRAVPWYFVASRCIAAA